MPKRTRDVSGAKPRKRPCGLSEDLRRKPGLHKQSRNRPRLELDSRRKSAGEEPD